MTKCEAQSDSDGSALSARRARTPPPNNKGMLGGWEGAELYRGWGETITVGTTDLGSSGEEGMSPRAGGPPHLPRATPLCPRTLVSLWQRFHWFPALPSTLRRLYSLVTDSFAERPTVKTMTVCKQHAITGSQVVTGWGEDNWGTTNVAGSPHWVWAKPAPCRAWVGTDAAWAPSCHGGCQAGHS